MAGRRKKKPRKKPPAKRRPAKPTPPPEQAHGLPPPYVISFIVCDDVITDMTTRKRTLVGVFGDIIAPGFPSRHPKLSIYTELTNGHGTQEIAVRLVYAATDDQVFDFHGPITFPDPRAVVHMHFTANNILFAKPGEYRFQLRADGELLIERRIVLREPPVEGKENEDA